MKLSLLKQAAISALMASSFVSVSTPSQAQFNPVPRFYETFVGDGDIGQCNGAAYGTFSAQIGDWTPEVRIDTDRRSGGCQQSFAILDENNELQNLFITVNFRSDGGDAGQCGNPGQRLIPVNTDSSQLQFSIPYRIDTDNRSGGCLQTFSLAGRNDVVLDVRFTADGDSGQCGNTGTFTVTPTTPVTFRIDTDNRSGGCRQAFRLRFR